MQQILDVLGNCEDATKEFSKESTTLSQAIPIIQGMKLCLSITKRNPSLHEDIIQLADDLYEDLAARFNYLEFSKNYLMATILDPRFKARLFSTREVSEMVRSLLTAAVDEKLNKQITKQSPAREPQASTSQGIWGACQSIIDEAEMEEPLAIFSGSFT